MQNLSKTESREDGFQIVSTHVLLPTNHLVAHEDFSISHNVDNLRDTLRQQSVCFGCPVCRDVLKMQIRLKTKVMLRSIMQLAKMWRGERQFVVPAGIGYTTPRCCRCGEANTFTRFRG